MNWIKIDSDSYGTIFGSWLVCAILIFLVAHFVHNIWISLPVSLVLVVFILYFQFFSDKPVHITGYAALAIVPLIMVPTPMTVGSVASRRLPVFSSISSSTSAWNMVGSRLEAPNCSPMRNSAMMNTICSALLPLLK